MKMRFFKLVATTSKGKASRSYRDEDGMVLGEEGSLTLRLNLSEVIAENQLYRDGTNRWSSTRKFAPLEKRVRESFRADRRRGFELILGLNPQGLGILKNAEPLILKGKTEFATDVDLFDYLPDEAVNWIAENVNKDFGNRRKFESEALYIPGPEDSPIYYNEHFGHIGAITAMRQDQFQDWLDYNHPGYKVTQWEERQMSDLISVDAKKN